MIADADIDHALAALRAGEAVVLPTDTVYGLAALPTVPGAVDRLYDLKGRSTDVPIAVLVATVEQVEALAELTPAARRLAEAFWPGPLTLVLPRRAGVDLPLGEPVDTIGVRLPAHRLVATLAAEVGPLATSSANRSGQPTPLTASEAAASLAGAVGAVLDDGPCAGTPSTVVDVTGDEPRILREGPITAPDVAGALG